MDLWILLMGVLGALLRWLIHSLHLLPPLLKTRSAAGHVNELCAFLDACASTSAACQTVELHALASILRDRRVDLNASTQRHQNKTCVHLAVESGNVETLSLVLSLPGIDLNRLDDEQQTPLTLAFRNGNLLMMVMLLRDPRSDLDGAAGTLNPATWATWNMDAQAMRLLDCASSARKTLLHPCCFMFFYSVWGGGEEDKDQDALGGQLRNTSTSDRGDRLVRMNMSSERGVASLSQRAARGEEGV